MTWKQSANIDALIHELGNADDATRWEARQSLVALGRDAVPQLIPALKDSRILVRWQVTQILASLRDPSAAPALVETLADDDSGVRWSAVKALIAMKEQAIVPLLQGLVHPKSTTMFDSAHHVLKSIPLSHELRTRVSPVLDALGGTAPDLEVPLAARMVLAALGK